MYICCQRPKFCPFCNFVFERNIHQYIKSKHYEQLKVPKLTSASEINNKIKEQQDNGTLFSMMVPLHRIIYTMGVHWSNPEIRNIGYK